MMAHKTTPVRILQVVDRLIPGGGVQDWLMNVARRIDRERFQMDFLTTCAEHYDDELREPGYRVFIAPSYYHLWAYSRFLSRVIREHGPYDILHAHAHYHCGHILPVAARAGIPVRLVHSHVNSTWELPSLSFFRRLFYKAMLKSTRHFATDGLAVSQLTATGLFGNDWQADKRWRIFPAAIHMDAFKQENPDKKAIRDELGIPADAFVVGHVGRFVAVKNHAFLIEVICELTTLNPGAVLLLIGHGPLFAAIQEEVERRNLGQHVIFTGFRADIARLMLGAMDVFVLPSLSEGVPVVLMEAQAAGLPIVSAQSATPGEIVVVKPLVKTLALEDGAKAWAQALHSMEKPAVTRLEAQQAIEASVFNIDNNVRALESLFCELATR